MNYIDLNIRTNDSEQSEIFIAQLSDWPFDSFDDRRAYCMPISAKPISPPAEKK